jgi:hypothetical protein
MTRTGILVGLNIKRSRTAVSDRMIRLMTAPPPSPLLKIEPTDRN